MSALLAVKNISKSYRQQHGIIGSRKFRVLHEISFELARAEILAVVGESGSGKSTLARQVVGLEKPDCGDILFNGRAVADVLGIHQSIRMIFQNPIASLNPRMRVFQLLEEPLLNYTDNSVSERKEKIEQVLQRVGLASEQATRYPHMFSGGQRQRLAIARALILQPEIIVADEAVSALDVSVQAQILNLVHKLKAEHGMAWLFIAHDINVVRAIADRVIVLYAGRVMETGSVSDVLQKPLHPYTRELLDSAPGTVELAGNTDVRLSETDVDSDVLQQGCVYRKRCPLADEQCVAAAPAMKTSADRSVACFHVET